MEIVKNLVNPSKYNIKCPYEMTAEFIVVHNTYNDAPARNEIAYMISNNTETSFHYAIDDKEIVQGIPENRNAWHASDGGKGKGNRKGIAIEICYSESGGEKFIAAEKLTAKFIAFKLKEKGWGIDKVKKHQDFANKYCPHRTLDMGWDRFIKMVQAEVDALNPKPNVAEPTPKSNGECTVTLPMLKNGSKGEQVKAMQVLLIGYGYKMENNGKVYGADGSFGGATDKALRSYQKDKGLDVDGICGPKTWAKLLGVSA